jgi:hypothetical protein
VVRVSWECCVTDQGWVAIGLIVVYLFVKFGRFFYR